MQLTRRLILTGAAACAGVSVARDARAQAANHGAAFDPRMSDRADGEASAPIVVTEWFSFTCHFCAHFAADVFPEIKAKQVDTGKLRLVYREYPRDQVDLMAAMVARTLPPTRYEPFKDALLATQAHWAFDRNVDSKEELAKMAALAGMPRDVFDRVTADDALKIAILGAQAQAGKDYEISATPTFIFDNHAHTGEAGSSYAGFMKMLSRA